MKRKEPQISNQGMFLITMGIVVGVGLWIGVIFEMPNSVTHTNLSKLPPVAIDSTSGGGSSSSATGGSSAGSSGSSTGGSAASGTSSSGGANGLPFAVQSPKDTVLVDKTMPGYALFQNTCAGCHGNDMQGVVGPELRGIGNVATAAELIPVITKGFNGLMPPGGGLTDPNQIKQIAEWVAAQKQK